MKRVSVALTLGFCVIAAQACTAGSADPVEIGNDGKAVCETEDGDAMFAELANAMAEEFGQLNPVKQLAVQNNKFGSLQGIVLSSASNTYCNGQAHQCLKTKGVLEMQNPALNSSATKPYGIDPAYFDANVFRSKAVSQYQDQKNWEASLQMNNPGALPPDHELTLIGESNLGGCGLHYEYAAVAAGCGGSAPSTPTTFEVLKEAEHFTSIDMNGSQHYFSNLGWGMRIDQNWGHMWTGNIAQQAPTLVYQVNFPAAGTYKLWVLGNGADGGSDSAYGGINDTTNGQMMDFPDYGSGWASIDINVPSAGNHNVHIFAREDGTTFDKVGVNQSSNPPGGSSGGSSGGSNCDLDTQDLRNRMIFFGANAGNDHLDFRATDTSILIDPTETGETGSSTDPDSNSNNCSENPPATGADPIRLFYNYNQGREGDCCWALNGSGQSYRASYMKTSALWLTCTGPWG